MPEGREMLVEDGGLWEGCEVFVYWCKTAARSATAGARGSRVVLARRQLQCGGVRSYTGIA